MQEPPRRAPADYTATYPLDLGDAAVITAMRAMVAPAKGAPMGIEARGGYDAFMEGVQPRDGVTFEADTLGGIRGVWAHPADARQDEAILHLHGGWFNFGSANAYRHFVAQIASRAGARAFIPDYQLAPEHPFPVAPDDALASYLGLVERGVHRIAITGDSAGGNLALGLAARMSAEAGTGKTVLTGIAAVSPVTDLTLSGASYETRAEADPLFTHPQVARFVQSYLGNAAPENPRPPPSTPCPPASPPFLFTSATMKCCWTIHGALRSVLSPRPSMRSWKYGWGCRMASTPASKD
jgi:monoterpene epsilon-lactone hydrolase